MDREESKKKASFCKGLELGLQIGQLVLNVVDLGDLVVDVDGADGESGFEFLLDLECATKRTLSFFWSNARSNSSM